MQHRFHFGIQRAVGTQHDVEQKISVLARDVHEHVNRPAQRLIFPMPVVKPVADGGVGLPRIRIDAAVHAALVILHPAAVGRLLAIVNGRQLAADGAGGCRCKDWQSGSSPLRCRTPPPPSL